MRKALLTQCYRLPTSWNRFHNLSVVRLCRNPSWGQIEYPAAKAIHSKSIGTPDGSSSIRSNPGYKPHPWSDLERVVKDLTSKHQIYISPYLSPFKNLSIEHYLLQNTPEDSRVLFLYVNKPCVVIGRNQNPWLETNLPMAHISRRVDVRTRTYQLVRRRSGGGAVYHDKGNLNYSVICPAAEFTRDKHAQMVASALTSIGVKSARVNERHDIVIGNLDAGGSFKVSGSAYKLTRQRALHHGTLLLNSVLENVSQYLNSPALPYIKARGVESVKSAVTNLLPQMTDLSEKSIQLSTQLAIIEQFASLHSLDLPSLSDLNLSTDLQVGDGWVVGRSFQKWDHLVRDLPEIELGLRELSTNAWRFGQTPQFVFSTHPTDEDPRERPQLPSHLPPSTRIYLKIHNAVIIDSNISFSADATIANAQKTRIHGRLMNQSFTLLGDWRPYLVDPNAPDSSGDAAAQVGKWLNRTLPSPEFLTKQSTKTGLITRVGGIKRDFSPMAEGDSFRKMHVD